MNLKDLVQSLLFYVGIPAATLYPLGFAALAIQLWNDPLFPYYEFDTVWYAATLVQNTQVVGTGFRLIFLSSSPRPSVRGLPCWSRVPCTEGAGLASRRSSRAGGRDCGASTYSSCCP